MVSRDMAVLVADCPRCNSARMTFDVRSALTLGVEYGWQHWYEAFCICRNCSRSTIFVLSEKTDAAHEFFKKNSPATLDDSLNNHFAVDSYISLKDRAAYSSPEHVPKNIADAFNEGATCLAVECWNAAAAMFRLCIDLATRPRLPEGEV